MESDLRHVKVSPSSASGEGPCDLRASKAFADLARTARHHAELDLRMADVLPAPWRGHVHLAGCRHGQLVFLVPSPAWATRVRTLQTQLLDAAHKLGINDARSVAVKVGVFNIERPRAAAPQHLSSTAAAHLADAAAATQDHELRDMFLELAALANPAQPSSDQT